MTHALSRFCCFTGVGIQFGVTVTLATATLDVLALALLDGQQNTRHNASHDSEEQASLISSIFDGNTSSYSTAVPDDHNVHR